MSNPASRDRRRGESGYEVVGRVPETPIGQRTMLKLPADAPGHEGDDGLKTALIADPDGRRIELVQWPAGHTDGMTSADWAEKGE